MLIIRAISAIFWLLHVTDVSRASEPKNANELQWAIEVPTENLKNFFFSVNHPSYTKLHRESDKSHATVRTLHGSDSSYTCDVPIPKEGDLTHGTEMVTLENDVEVLTLSYRERMDVYIVEMDSCRVANRSISASSNGCRTRRRTAPRGDGFDVIFPCESPPFIISYNHTRKQWREMSLPDYPARLTSTDRYPEAPESFAHVVNGTHYLLDFGILVYNDFVLLQAKGPVEDFGYDTELIKDKIGVRYSTSNEAIGYCMHETIGFDVTTRVTCKRLDANLKGEKFSVTVDLGYVSESLAVHNSKDGGVDLLALRCANTAAAGHCDTYLHEHVKIGQDGRHEAPVELTKTFECQGFGLSRTNFVALFEREGRKCAKFNCQGRNFWGESAAKIGVKCF